MVEYVSGSAPAKWIHYCIHGVSLCHNLKNEESQSKCLVDIGQ